MGWMGSQWGALKTDRMVEPTGWLVISGTKFRWRPVTRSIHQGSILDPVLFSIFISDLHDGAEVFRWHKTGGSGRYIRGLC